MSTEVCVHDEALVTTPKGSIIVDRLKWINEQGKTDKEESRTIGEDKLDGIQKGIASDRSKWLQNIANSSGNGDRKGDESSPMKPTVAKSYGGSFVADRMRWINEQGKPKEFESPAKGKLSSDEVQIQKGIASDRARWLQSIANKESEEEKRNSDASLIQVSASYGGSLIANRMEWLEKESQNEYNGPKQDKVDLVSAGLQKGVAAERAKWLQADAFTGKEKQLQESKDGAAEPHMSPSGRKSLVEDRMKWLDGQSKNKDFVEPRQDTGQGCVQEELAKQRSKWLKNRETNEETQLQDTVQKKQATADNMDRSCDKVTHEEKEKEEEENTAKQQERNIKINPIDADVGDNSQQESSEKGTDVVEDYCEQMIENNALPIEDRQNSLEEQSKTLEPKKGLCHQEQQHRRETLELVQDRKKWLSENIINSKQNNGPKQEIAENYDERKDIAADRSKWLKSVSEQFIEHRKKFKELEEKKGEQEQSPCNDNKDPKEDDKKEDFADDNHNLQNDMGSPSSPEEPCFKAPCVIL